jgi:hypothetical protein
MGYPSRHYPDSMANSYYSYNYSNEFIREREFVSRTDYQRYIKRSKARSQQAHFQEQVLQSMWEILEDMKQSIDTFVNKYGGCVDAVQNHDSESLNRHPAYEENINYGENNVEVINLVELPLQKQFVQPLPFVPTTALIEEHPPPPPPQAQLITITTEEKSNVDSFEENRKVEDDIQKEIVGEIFMEGDNMEKTCFDAIYVDFSKYLSPEEPRVPYHKENSRTSFFQVGVSDVGRNLPIVSVNFKIRKIANNILRKCRSRRFLFRFRQWKYRRKDLVTITADCQPYSVDTKINLLIFYFRLGFYLKIKINKVLLKLYLFPFQDCIYFFLSFVDLYLFISLLELGLLVLLGLGLLILLGLGLFSFSGFSTSINM